MRRALLLLALLAGCAEDAPPATDEPAPAYPDANLILISLDTLRASDTTPLGGPPNISPTLARLADESVVFTNARANAPHTAPSHMTLFTSLPGAVHQVQNVAFKEDERGNRRPQIVPLADGVPTLAEVLSAAGFTTVGLTDGGNLNPPHGFLRGFDEYTYDLSGVEAQVADAERRLDDLARSRFFLFWHTYQIHAPYVPDERYARMYAPEAYDGVMKERVESLKGMTFKERFNAMRSVYWVDRERFSWPEAAYLHGLYRGGVRQTDDVLGALIGSFERRGLLETSVLVLLSDHGEEFFEHGRWQHEQLYEECLRVPLMIRLPDGRGAGRRVETPVSLIDVMPTVLDLLDVPRDGLALLGRSLAPAILDGAPLEERPVISELHWDRGDQSPENLVAVTFRGLKYIHDEQWGRHRLYDLEADPAERDDIYAEGHPRLAALEKLYEAFALSSELQRSGEAVVTDDVPPEMVEQLAQLGYLEGTDGR